ncbi:activated RNA polymerase II transcriptional coactivator p15-like [Orbicella faveolata]|uniref:activated RNA polymerase II transcriptional coactivator p15-like n=1 Tax=Orbicella faveolata TaxID=48498 RepID=UPI0009E366AA|nr:activated RNA polymerase II transcriptional coactivator p15-like [Orbicella faveolata]
MSKRSKEKPTKSESESSEEEEVKPKKSKTSEKSSSSSKKSSRSSKDEDFGVFEIGNKRKVSVREFKGRLLIDIREFYEKDGELMPGKKGISLQLEQWEKLKNLVGDIDEAIEELRG